MQRGFTNTISVFFGLSIRLLFQSLYFFLAAKTLQPEQYGLFSGSLSYVLLLAPFANWGNGNILVRDVSRDQSNFKLSWSIAFSNSIISAIPVSIISIFIGYIIFPEKEMLVIVILLTIGDYWGTRFSELSAQAFQANYLMSFISPIYIFQSFIKLLLAFILYLLHFDQNAVLWAFLFMVASLISGMASVLLVCKILTSPIFSPCLELERFIEGFYFSLSTASQSTYNDIDKVMLLKISGGSTAGQYSLAYKLLDIVTLPIASIISVSYPTFFRSGKLGIRGLYRVLLKIIPVTIILALFGAVAIYLSKSLIHFLFNDKYMFTYQIAILLTPIIFLRLMSNIGMNTLSGIDHQRERSIFQLLIAIINIILNIVLISALSWRGAVISSIISECLLFMSLWIYILFLMKTSRQEA